MNKIILKMHDYSLIYQSDSCDGENLKAELLQTPQIIQAPTLGIVTN